MVKTILSILSVLLVVACGSNNQPKTKENEKHDLVVGYDTLKLGLETFEEKCVVCHGIDGKLGASGAKILPETKMNLDEIKNQVIKGKKAMPSFSQVLTEDQIIAVAKYVLTLKDTLK